VHTQTQILGSDTLQCGPLLTLYWSRHNNRPTEERFAVRGSAVNTRVVKLSVQEHQGSAVELEDTRKDRSGVGNGGSKMETVGEVGMNGGVESGRVSR